ncbi:MAG: bifunctional phosphopantothenoylcysteine decarboxylase/phosphopantothenate--cysteine ligase CoaBC [Clostridia bacterium]|nr:bifunctional phosphopantothenoylcysteine decarboxylase/phosphopantothenate--cysteine ligase CoaBC [Clostridia bacterium]
MFKDKLIVVGITGSIAAYKAVELVSNLRKKGADVHCVMTDSAQEFLTPLTLRTLSQNPVITAMFAEPKRWNVEHVGLAEAADLVMVVPASANIIGKVCHGIADDFLTTMIMATKAPVLFAPAMNVQMYLNPIVQKNIAVLKEQGYHFVGPGSGNLACGTEGQGRLIELSVILARAEELLVKEKPLLGKKVLVTAGPTREFLDPVRFLTNRSSGRMGYAVAKQAYLLGADVVLISGPTEIQPFPGVQCIRIETAQEMYEAVLAQWEDCQVIIKAAAVADYRPQSRNPEKMKKQSGDLQLVLSRNPDILAELGKKKKSQILVGFAAETENVLASAAEKAMRKNLDFIVANDVTREGAGFALDTNIVSFVFPNGEIRELEIMSKDDVAKAILKEVIKKLQMRSDGDG